MEFICHDIDTPASLHDAIHNTEICGFDLQSLEVASFLAMTLLEKKSTPHPETLCVFLFEFLPVRRVVW